MLMGLKPHLRNSDAADCSYECYRLFLAHTQNNIDVVVISEFNNAVVPTDAWQTHKMSGPCLVKHRPCEAHMTFCRNELCLSRE